MTTAQQTIKDHTSLLNYIAKKIQAKYYLEIGILNVANNFNKIAVKFKEGIDPAVDHPAVAKMTSDEFFSEPKLARYDLVFIDGLHHADQAKRDTINSWKVLNPWGIILLHDTNPQSEHITHEPRDNKIWCGGTFRTACQIVSPKFTIDMDYGCTIIRKDGVSELSFLERDINWDNFNWLRGTLLSLVSIEEGLKIIDSWT